MMLPLTFSLALFFGPPTRADLDFVMASEESIMAFAEPGTPRYTPPEPFGTLIRQLGDERWWTREHASRELTRWSIADQRWLFWARRHHDPEIRVRSNVILRRLNPCRSCGETGHTRYERYDQDPITGEFRWVNWCPECFGCGSLWIWSAWD